MPTRDFQKNEDSRGKKFARPHKRVKDVKNRPVRVPSVSREADDDYIVFCFKDDDEFHLINDSSKEKMKHIDAGESNSEFEDAEQACPAKKNDEKTENDDLSPWQQSSCRRWRKESIDSNQSNDSSTASFSFPVLGWEWMGSPVHMPKSHEKHKPPRCVRFQCCRF